MLPFIEAYTSNHADATGCTEFVDQKKIGLIRFYRNPLKFNGEACPIYRGAPLVGEDSKSILASIGYTDEQIEELLESGIIGESLF